MKIDLAASAIVDHIKFNCDNHYCIFFKTKVKVFHRLYVVYNIDEFVNGENFKSRIHQIYIFICLCAGMATQQGGACMGEFRAMRRGTDLKLCGAGGCGADWSSFFKKINMGQGELRV